MESKEFHATCGVLASTSRGRIMRFTFRGEDHVSRGPKVGAFVEDQLSEHAPAAIVFEFTACRELFDNDIASLIPAFFDQDREVRRPCAVVATGRAARSAMTLLDLSQLADAFGVRVFDDCAGALAFLEDEVGKQQATEFVDPGLATETNSTQ